VNDYSELTADDCTIVVISASCSYCCALTIGYNTLFHGRHRRPISHHWVWSVISTHNLTRLWPLKRDQLITLHAIVLATLKSFARGRQNRTNFKLTLTVILTPNPNSNT